MTSRVLSLLYLLAVAACYPVDDEQKVSDKTIRYCQPQTPCGWKFYNSVDYPEINLTNTYCQCRPGQKCDEYEPRLTVGYVEYRCQLAKK